MSKSRREFLIKGSMASLAFGWHKGIMDFQEMMYTGDKVNWEAVRALFPIAKWDKIHFNSGSAGVMPVPVQTYLFELIQTMNSKAPYQAWSDWQGIKKTSIQRISQALGVEQDEIMIVRNTTEALNMIIFGLPLKAGDEIIAAHHDYPFALNALRQREKRDGIQLKLVDLKLPVSDEEVLSAYEARITPNTKAMLVTYMTHRHGHIMPLTKLTALAHTNGIQVVVDGAHAFAQFEHNLREMDVDYYATSLHKWLNAPHGCGVIFVKKDHIARLHSHPSSNLDAQNRIDKFEHIGTRAFHQEVGIQAALDFHDSLGPMVKQKRLHELKMYWTRRVEDIPKVHLHTDVSAQKSCAVATFAIEGLSGGQIVKRLDHEFNMHAKSVGGRWGSGVRISVNVFTNTRDLDQLLNAIQTLASA